MNRRFLAFLVFGLSSVLVSAQPEGRLAPLPGPAAPLPVPSPGNPLPPAVLPSAVAVLPPMSAVPHRPVSIRYATTPNLKLPFRLEEVGPAGFTGLELWVTRDRGQWEKIPLKDIADDKKPFQFNASSDGLYGFTAIARNRAGQVDPALYTGVVEPQLWVCVDTKPPTAEFQTPLIHGNLADRRVLFQWKAEDANLGPKPITLEYSAEKDGPWKPIIEKGENASRLEWLAPADLPVFVYLRLQVRDQAGNLATAQATEPAVLDFSRPRVKLLGLE